MSRTFDFFPLRYGHFVAAVVFWILGVALDPVVVEFVLLGQGEQPLPEVGIQGGLLVALDPALFLPAPAPARLPRIDDILGAGL